MSRQGNPPGSRARAHQSKGERTRSLIVERAAVLFNTRGVAGASMADVSEATGLEKGGVYNHFATKQELAVAAFEYSAARVRERIEASFASESHPLDRLRAFLEGYRRASDRSYFPGGCPLMNTAVEADDTNPELRRKARAAIEAWRRLIATTLEEGIGAGQIVPVDTNAVASTMVATIEGSIMLAKLYADGSHICAAVDHLHAFLDSLDARTSASAR